ncbi:hypothetical protein EST38_g5407 [Candolleomyces aberdarensis]|uniref:Uncharacterized protein n=1 Tax=Candolleomyces aberdarensis TaxID=2316362 RepID=A0A4Q2DMD3_9AGAR|nr:hypothetical protein EST38_g5407 [Candolleomyces aberdarensis]
MSLPADERLKSEIAGKRAGGSAASDRAKIEEVAWTRWVENPEPKHISFPAHGSSVITCLLISHGRIISASDDHSINVYSLPTGELLLQLKGHEGGVWALAVSKDTLVSGSTDRTVRVWDLKTGKCTHIFGGHTSTIRCLAIVEPELVDVEDANGVDTDENPYHRFHLEGHEHCIRALAVRGRTLVSGSYDSTVRLWDVITGELKRVLKGHTQKVYSVALDLGRNQAYSGSMDGTARVWDLRTGDCRHTLTGHTSLVGLIELSPSHLVSASADATLRIWDPDSGELQHTLAAHTGAITCFQHDEFKVLSGSDGNLKMWNIRDGTVVRDLLTGVTDVWQVVFEGRWCVAATYRKDSTVLYVWDFGVDSEDLLKDTPGYDEDSKDLDDEEDEGAYKIKRFIEAQVSADSLGDQR